MSSVISPAIIAVAPEASFGPAKSPGVLRFPGAFLLLRDYVVLDGHGVLVEVGDRHMDESTQRYDRLLFRDGYTVLDLPEGGRCYTDALGQARTGHLRLFPELSKGFCVVHC